MISSDVMKTIQATVPVLAEHGQAITTIFYQKMFAAHPELKNMFNMAHQAKGEQQRALAEAVLNYASKIDQLVELGPMVKRIAHKHASLNIQPEHYPIVGKYLLEAIQVFLNLPQDHEILRAWGVAYSALAQIFIDTESAVYCQNAEMKGGWLGFKPFKISKIVQETQDIKSFYLIPEDGQLVDFKAGQYVGVKLLNVADGYDAIRQYSLSSMPGENYYRITVKAESNDPENKGIVSNLLHNYTVGDVLYLQPPTGDFVLVNQDKHRVFIAGGVGITPLLSMLQHSLKEGGNANITFIQAVRNKEHHLMNEWFKQLKNQGLDYYCSYDDESGADHQGYLTEQVLSRWIPSSDVEVYCCGPNPFMSAMKQQCILLNIPEAQFHYEVFGPSLTIA